MRKSIILSAAIISAVVLLVGTEETTKMASASSSMFTWRVFCGGISANEKATATFNVLSGSTVVHHLVKVCTSASSSLTGTFLASGTGYSASVNLVDTTTLKVLGTGLSKGQMPPSTLCASANTYDALGKSAIVNLSVSC